MLSLVRCVSLWALEAERLIRITRLVRHMQTYLRVLRNDNIVTWYCVEAQPTILCPAEQHSPSRRRWAEVGQEG